MPARRGSRPLKAWRYVGVFTPELMLCAATVRVGPFRQEFWAIWDRRTRQLHERTRRRRAAVSLAPGALRVRERGVEIDIRLGESAGVETVCASGRAYAWTRKQGGIEARGTVRLGGTLRPVAGRAVVDDSAGYHERHTRWHWSAGVGTTVDGRAAAWNLVAGINDPPHGSERTVWIGGVPQEVGPAAFAPDLSAVGTLRFHAEAVRGREENLLLLRSRYRQPFGTFSGELPGAGELAEGLGVMEFHDVLW